MSIIFMPMDFGPGPKGFKEWMQFLLVGLIVVLVLTIGAYLTLLFMRWISPIFGNPTLWELLKSDFDHILTKRII